MAFSKPTNLQPLRKTTATLYLTTFILTLTTLSTTAAVSKTHSSIPLPKNQH